MKRDPYEDLYDENSLNSGRHQHYFNENYIVMKIYRFDKNHFFHEKLLLQWNIISIIERFFIIMMKFL